MITHQSIIRRIMDFLPLELIVEIGTHLSNRDRGRFGQTCRCVHQALRDCIVSNLRYSYQRKHYYGLLKWFDQYPIAIDRSSLGKDPLFVAMNLAKRMRRSAVLLGCRDQNGVTRVSQLARLRNIHLFTVDHVDAVTWNQCLAQQAIIIVDITWDTIGVWTAHIIEAIVAGCRVLILTSQRESLGIDMVVDLIKTFPSEHLIILPPVERGKLNHEQPMVFTMDPPKTDSST